MSIGTFREWLRESEKISLTEVQRTGHQERGEFSAEKEWIRLSKNNLTKLLKSKDNYSLYKYHDYLF
jgi:tyrosine-protein phosphatase YwqE